MAKFIIPEYYNLYESAYGSDLPFQQLYLIFFKTIPSKYDSKMSFDISCIDFLKKNKFKEIIKNEFVIRIQKNLVFPFINYDHNHELVLIEEDNQILIKAIISVDDKVQSVTLSILYNIQNCDIKNVIYFEELMKLERKKKKSNISLVKSDMGSLDVEEFDLNVNDIDLELNYGSSFVKVHDLIIKRLNNRNDKGIILLHGDPGTGKTSYIKYLTKLIDGKEILFIPPSMAETLSEPSIIPFLMDHKNSILIIEDAERVISDREINGSSPGVSNILNLTDGILGDCLNIQIIATFNMKREKIDHALLRKGRLIAEHKFTNLSIDNTNKLLKHLGKDHVSYKEMCLADIYNVDTEIYKINENNSKIGF